MELRAGFGRVWRVWGRLSDALARLRGGFWGASERLWEALESCGRLWEALGKLEGGLGEALGRLWGGFGRLGEALGRLWEGPGEPLGGSGEALGGSEEALGGFLLLPPSLPPLYIKTFKLPINRAAAPYHKVIYSYIYINI